VRLMGAHSLGGAERSLRTSSPSATAYIELCGAEFSEKKTEGEHQASPDNHLQDRGWETPLHVPISNEGDRKQLDLLKDEASSARGFIRASRPRRN
jgi:hypothetical protein